ncbi:4'-phosphopantetheinyl transferase superfamily protein [Methyloversatilis sp. RAC08]|uniref:4'-phosphopantetheinyl transferase family protein n=1 Tax=Methyloversatilis sp. RAC08 TaxID=1842540 RepID=UPI00083E5117|nr:4'-phosphopantetheinyl transferase superfamily protein [Methyloversatilis sp. RAC08]AOF81972.1 4'-phosphopantetheinyl transferase superfamily protein [Methyloversatilis sp. RAC08]
MKDCLWDVPAHFPQMTGDDIHLWRAHLDEAYGNESLITRISADERCRADRLQKPGDRALFVLAHTMLREVLGCYLGLTPSEIMLETGACGKPRLAWQHGSSLQFSLSHSGRLALLGISQRREIGVDVEAAVPHDDLANVAAHFFSPGERTALARVGDTDRSDLFYMLWTRKEACVKAWGKGLQIPLHGFSVLPSTDAWTESPILCPDVDTQTLGYCRSVPVPEGYAAAVAVAGSGSRLSCRHWSAVSLRQR